MHYSRAWRDIAMDVNNKIVWMMKKEVTVFSSSHNKTHSVTNFMAQGGGHCCAITAKILGREISKCYYKWVRVGKDCQAKKPGHLAECVFPTSLGQGAFTKFGRNKTYNNAHDYRGKDGSFKKLVTLNETHLDNSTLREAVEMTYRDFLKNVSQEIVNDVLIGVNASLRLSVEMSLKILKMNIDAKVEGDFNLNSQDEKTPTDLVTLQRAVGESFHRHLHDIISRKFFNETKEKMQEIFDLQKRFGGFREEIGLEKNDYSENHIVRNIVKWPDVLRRAQLYFVCNGNEMALNNTEDFSNNAEFLELVAIKERKMGYPDPSVYETCDEE
ncbi:hypothetical protein Ddc_24857 [Ditylenchus destructor]|nr:hypothetical protein Ddc_24857 [Ditylenchus destructor]